MARPTFEVNLACRRKPQGRGIALRPFTWLAGDATIKDTIVFFFVAAKSGLSRRSNGEDGSMFLERRMPVLRLALHPEEA
jgi:hypothetical protein